jgi:hypothetical protein
MDTVFIFILNSKNNKDIIFGLITHSWLSSTTSLQFTIILVDYKINMSMEDLNQYVHLDFQLYKV